MRYLDSAWRIGSQEIAHDVAFFELWGRESPTITEDTLKPQKLIGKTLSFGG